MTVEDGEAGHPIAEKTQPITPLTGGTRPLPEVTTAPLPDDVPARVRYSSGAAAVPKDQQPGWDSHTLTMPTELAGDAPARLVPRRGRLRWVLALLGVAVLVAAGIVASMLHNHKASPSGAVSDYFTALGNGDTSAALALVENSGTFLSPDNPLLSPAALATTGERPSHASVTGTSGSDVTVSYRVGGETVIQTITVVNNSVTTRPYLLREPFITVAVPDAGGRAVTVNSIPVTAGAAHLIAFPGVYTAQYAGNRLLAASTVDAGYQASAGAVTATFKAPSPELATGATKAVQDAVDAALDGCAGSTSAAPPKCPFAYSDKSASLSWKIGSYPTIKLAVVGGKIKFADGSHTGQVAYTATTYHFFGLFPSTSTGTLKIDANGTATPTDTSIAITFDP